MATGGASNIGRLGEFSAENAVFSFTDARTLRIKGVISMRSPSTVFLPYLEQVHSAAVSDKIRELRVDVTELTFMNSSSIRLFVDWIEWVRAGKEGARYVLHFVTNPELTWQEMTFSVLKTFGGEHVLLTPGAARKRTGNLQ
jgi:hypothetical protein